MRVWVQVGYISLDVGGNMGRDFDKEFDRLMSENDGLSGSLEDDGFSDNQISADLGEDEIPYGIPPENFEIEEVRPTEDGKRCVGLILTELLYWQALQKLVDMNDLPGRALGTETGAVLWVPVENQEEDEFAALLGEARPIDPILEETSLTLASMIGRNVIALQSWLSVDEDDSEVSVAGQIAAHRYTPEGDTEQMHGGLVVAALDEAVEDLLVGRTDPLTHEHYRPPSLGERAMQALHDLKNRRKGNK